jgi:glucose/arabinose dehydrogenase
MSMRSIVGCAAGALALLTGAAFAQQQVPMRNGIPVAPTGLTVPPLGAGPFAYQTAEGQDIRVVVLVRGLAHPWSLAFLPNGELLVTERTGNLRIVRGGKLDAQPIAGVPIVRAAGLSGLFDVVLHPQFAENRFVYLSYNKPVDERRSGLGVAGGGLGGRAVTNLRDIIV